MKVRFRSIARPLSLALCLGFGATLFAYNPPTGGELMPSWYSPLFMGGGDSVASSSGPSSDAINPAASASQQRFTIDTSYIALLGLGAEDGWGSAINLGASMPNPFGVFGTGLRLVIVPADLASMPLGTSFNLRGTFAKELSEQLMVGIGLAACFGSTGAAANSSDWSLGADLGFIAHPGTIRFMRNFRWGGVLAGLGKWYAPGNALRPNGDIDIAFPSPFTIKAGAGFDLVATKAFRLSVSGDVSLPYFMNVIMDLGVGAYFGDAFGITIGEGFNLAETIEGSYKSFIPSFGFQASFPITTSKEKDSFLSKNGWDKSDLSPSIGLQPLYNGVWGIGAGISLPLGVIDRNAPVIEVGYPETPYDMYYVSPNSDGQNDEIVLPLAIRDERYVMGYSLKILDDKGNLVREIQNKESRPENTGFKQVMSQLAYSKKGVQVPKEVKWDGRTDAGTIAPDGAYKVLIESFDDNANRGESASYKLAIDSTAPAVALAAPKDPNGLIFSPDGDGNKDAIVIKAESSKEDNWNVEIRDTSDKTLRRLGVKDSSLGAISWDGKDDSGKAVPDGVYKLAVSSEDRAKNSVQNSLPNIVVDTAETSVYATASVYGFSPNGDGVMDDMSFGCIVRNQAGITGWRFAVRDADGNVRKSFAGNGSTVPERLIWDGKGDDGKVKDGLYQGVLTVLYAKGSQPEARTASVLVDTKAPELALNIAPAPFSPDNDGEDDEIGIAIGLRDASDIASWSLEIDESAVSDTNVSGKARLFMKYEGTGRPADKIVWDGKSLKGELVEAATDYPCRLTVSDVLGNKAVIKGVLPVDILVVRDGDRLKIKVPSIVFRPNFDDFKDLPAETVEKNTKVLKRIAQILNKYKSYKVRVEGHANNVGKIQGSEADAVNKEEKGDVLPLSEKRAAAVKAFLVKYKVDGARLTTRGLGSSEPVVDPTDADNRWKNRRVEFILEKK